MHVDAAFDELHHPHSEGGKLGWDKPMGEIGLEALLRIEVEGGLPTEEEILA